MCHVQLFLRLARLHVNVVLYLCGMSMFVLLRKLTSLKVRCLGLMLLILILNRCWTHLVVNGVVGCLPTCACLLVGRLGQLLFRHSIVERIWHKLHNWMYAPLGTHSFKLLFLTMAYPEVLSTGRGGALKFSKSNLEKCKELSLNLSLVGVVWQFYHWVSDCY